MKNMKALIALITAVTLILLFSTNSMYVEWIEVYIIIGGLSTISIVYTLFSKKKCTYGQIIGSSAIIGFFLSWLFSSIDLIADDVIFPKGIPDGRFLTQSEIFSEFHDDQLIIMLISTCAVVIITFLFSAIYLNFVRKRAV